MLTSEVRKTIKAMLNDGHTHQQVFDALAATVDDRRDLARNITLMPSKENLDKAKPLQSVVYAMLFSYLLFGFYTIRFFDTPILNEQHYWLKFAAYAVAMITATLVFMYKNQRIKIVVIFIPVLYMNFLIGVIAPQFTNFIAANLCLLIALIVVQAVYMNRLVKGNYVDSDR